MRLTQTAIALALALTAAGVGQAETEAPAPVVQEDAGAYLAARIALTDGRHREAAYWFDRALKADPANAALLDGAVISAMSLGILKPLHAMPSKSASSAAKAKWRPLPS